MASGDFTKEEAASCEEALTELMGAFPKGKKAEFFGHFNDLALFLQAAKTAAPGEKK